MAEPHLPNLHGIHANPKLEHTLMLVSAVLGIAGFVWYARNQSGAAAAATDPGIQSAGTDPAATGTAGTDNTAAIQALSDKTDAALTALQTQWGQEYTTVGADLTTLGTNQGALATAIQALQAAQSSPGAGTTTPPVSGPSLTLDLSVLNGSSADNNANAWDNSDSYSGSSKYTDASTHSGGSSGGGGISLFGVTLGGSGGSSNSNSDATDQESTYATASHTSGSVSSAYDTTFSQAITGTMTGLSADEMARVEDILSNTSRNAQLAAVDPSQLHQAYDWQPLGQAASPGAGGYNVASPYATGDVHNAGANNWGATPVADRPAAGQTIFGLGAGILKPIARQASPTYTPNPDPNYGGDLSTTAINRNNASGAAGGPILG